MQHYNFSLPELLHLAVPIFCVQIICSVKKHILTGGPKRLPFTVPPLIFNSLKVALLSYIILFNFSSFILLPMLFLSLYSWLGASRIRMKTYLKMRHLLLQRKSFKYWIRYLRTIGFSYQREKGTISVSLKYLCN